VKADSYDGSIAAMHSTEAEVTPELETTAGEPNVAAPPPAGEGKPSGHLRLWATIAAAATVVGAIVVAAIILVGSRGKPGTTADLARSSLNHPEKVLRLKGTTEAVQARALLAPMLSGQQFGTLTIVHLTPSGTRVKKGDPLAEFDRQAQIQDYFDKKAEYEKLVDQVTEEQAKESAAKAKDETELKQAEDDLRKAELEVQKNEIKSRIDAEENQETLEEAKATLDQLQQTFDLKRKAALAGIKILEIQRDRTEQTMMHAKANSDLMEIHAPIDGVVVLNTIWKQGTMGEVQEGDQVRPGVPFMQVVNPSEMQVRVMANQQDFPSLRVGEAAKVRLDAYPDLVFPAKVEQLAPIGEGGDFSNRLRQFAVVVGIEGNDPKLMPDLSAAVDVAVADDKTAGSGAHDGSRDVSQDGGGNERAATGGSR
jgi:multidrug resistance efflux pump